MKGNIEVIKVFDVEVRSLIEKLKYKRDYTDLIDISDRRCFATAIQDIDIDMAYHFEMSETLYGDYINNVFSTIILSPITVIDEGSKKKFVFPIIRTLSDGRNLLSFNFKFNDVHDNGLINRTFKKVYFSDGEYIFTHKKEVYIDSIYDVVHEYMNSIFKLGDENYLMLDYEVITADFNKQISTQVIEKLLKAPITTDVTGRVKPVYSLSDIGIYTNMNRSIITLNYQTKASKELSSDGKSVLRLIDQTQTPIYFSLLKKYSSKKLYLNPNTKPLDRFNALNENLNYSVTDNMIIGAKYSTLFDMYYAIYESMYGKEMLDVQIELHQKAMEVSSLGTQLSQQALSNQREEENKQLALVAVILTAFLSFPTILQLLEGFSLPHKKVIALIISCALSIVIYIWFGSNKFRRKK